MKLQAIIFDLDDTLYPERDFVLSGFRAVDRWLSANRHISGFYEMAAQIFDDGMRGDVFNRALEPLGYGHDQDLISKLVGVYRQHQPDIQLPAEAKMVIENLKPVYKLGLITDGFLNAQKNKVAALQIEPLVDCLVFSDELGGREAWKPSTIPYRAIESELGLSKRQLVYVGDNPEKDFLGAASVGWWSIRVRYPNREHSAREPLPGAAADLEIPNLSSLDEALQQLA